MEGKYKLYKTCWVMVSKMPAKSLAFLRLLIFLAYDCFSFGPLKCLPLLDLRHLAIKLRRGYT